MPPLYEVEFAAGLADLVRDELNTITKRQIQWREQDRPSELLFAFEGDHTHLLKSKTAIAVYRVLQFDIPRPKAILGHQNFQRLLHEISAIIAAPDEERYKSIFISAAGSDSSVMVRIKQDLAVALHLQSQEDEGDLMLRIRPSGRKRGWDVLIRLTPRPLATRTWRVENMEGALNASVAHAMVQLTNPTPQDSFLNLMCGSGTLLIERAEVGAVTELVGLDIHLDALNAAKANIQQAMMINHFHFLLADIRRLPFAHARFDVLIADLPFGQLVGSHDDNVRLYPHVMQESARVASKGARFVCITHEIRLMEDMLNRYQSLWQLQEERKITLSGLHPRIYVLERI